MAPTDVNTTKEKEVWRTLYGEILIGDLPKPRFTVGDIVRIYAYKIIFQKGYEANFTKEIFRVVKIHHGDPTICKIEAIDWEEIVGKFYKNEMSLLNEKGRERLEEILSEKRWTELEKKRK